jgi:hypothetical protein
MIRIVAPDGKKLLDLKTNRLYSEVICKDSEASRYVLADSEADPTIESLDGITLSDRVTDLEDAVVELAEIITEG